jgi:hypothetical protein
MLPDLCITPGQELASKRLPSSQFQEAIWEQAIVCLALLYLPLTCVPRMLDHNHLPLHILDSPDGNAPGV